MGVNEVLCKSYSLESCPVLTPVHVRLHAASLRNASLFDSHLMVLKLRQMVQQTVLCHYLSESSELAMVVTSWFQFGKCLITRCSLVCSLTTSFAVNKVFSFKGWNLSRN
jgi:hypothetical protein